MFNLKNRRNIFIYSREKTGTGLKISFSLFAFFISLSSLLLTVYSDTIVQNNNDIAGALSENEMEITLEELVNGGKSREIKKQKNIYIFALDISGELENTTLSNVGKDKYKSTVEEVNESINGQRIKENEKQPNIRDFAKARLSGILASLLKKNDSVKEQDKDEFAIWVIGEDSQRIFPNDKKVPVGIKSIESAIKKINFFNQHSSSTTDFVDLFTRLTNEFKGELKSDDTFLVLTILSNLLKDGDVQSKKIEDRWRQLEEKVQEISYSKVMVNMILLAEKEPDIQKTIIPLFKKNVEWYRLNKELLIKGVNKSFLYTVWNSDKSIIFPYVNPYNIDNSSFIIKNTWKSPCNIKMDMPSEINQFPIPRMSVFCEDVGERMRLISGGSELGVTLNINHTLKLIYSGRLPPNFSSPILRLSIENECITLLIPIDFVKKLPGWAYYIYIILKMGIWGCAGISVCFFILVVMNLRSSYREKFPSPVIVIENSLDGNRSSKTQAQLEERKLAKPVSIKLKTGDEIVELNTASHKKLQLLAGIGPHLASKIIDLRPIKNLEELRKIGVKKSDIEKLKDILLLE